jgi:hypothetical protein
LKAPALLQKIAHGGTAIKACRSAPS